MAHPGGAPSDYTQTLADKICLLISNGKPLRTIEKMSGMPSRVTVWRWIRDKPEFCNQYARAKEDYTEAMAEEILDISDDSSDDIQIIKDKQGNEREVVDWEVVNRSRLRVDTRKWLMSKLLPKKYGEKIEADVRFPDGILIRSNDKEISRIDVQSSSQKENT